MRIMLLSIPHTRSYNVHEVLNPWNISNQGCGKLDWSSYSVSPAGVIRTPEITSDYREHVHTS